MGNNCLGFKGLGFGGLEFSLRGGSRVWIM